MELEFKNVTATKSFSWAMSHMLANHTGLCRNLHGHNYQMEVTVQRSGNFAVGLAGPAEGMVIDFKDLKNFINSELVDPLDHAFMYWENSNSEAEKGIYDILRANNMKVVSVKYRPTAENMATDFLSWLNQNSSLIEAGFTVTKIKIWETPTSYAVAEIE